MHDYTGTPDLPDTIPLPDDNDLDRAAAFNPAFEGLKNSVLYLAASLVEQHVIAASGTLELDLTGVNWVRFTLVGGGGAGGYADNGGSGIVGGGGGGAGAIVEAMLPASEVPDELTVIVGAGGNATSDVDPENAGQATVVTAAITVPWSNFLLTAPGGAAGDKDGPGGAGGLRTGDSDTPQGGATGGANGESAFARGSAGAGGGASGGDPAEPGGDGGYSCVGCPGGKGGGIGQVGLGGRGYGAGGGGGRGGAVGSGGGGGAGGFGLTSLAENGLGTFGGAGADGVVIVTLYRGGVL